MIAIEFALVLLVFLSFMTLVTEFLRVSLVDQTLARATHMGALAAGRDPARCSAAAQEAFASDRLAAWLFDRNDDGSIGFLSASGTPDGTPSQEVRLTVAADDGSIANGIDFRDANGCGVGGSWIEVRATVPVRPRFRLGGTFLRASRSWTVNQG